MSDSITWPFLVIPGIGVLLAVGCFLLACRASRTISRLLFGFLALALCLPAVWVYLGLHPELVDQRVRAYKAFYVSIQPGMTHDEVLAALDRSYPAGGTRQRPKIVTDTSDRLSFCMSPEGERDPNCEGISIALQNGHVSSKMYVRD